MLQHLVVCKRASSRTSFSTFQYYEHIPNSWLCHMSHMFLISKFTGYWVLSLPITSWIVQWRLTTNFAAAQRRLPMNFDTKHVFQSDTYGTDSALALSSSDLHVMVATECLYLVTLAYGTVHIYIYRLAYTHLYIHTSIHTWMDIDMILYIHASILIHTRTQMGVPHKPIRRIFVGRATRREQWQVEELVTGGGRWRWLCILIAEAL